MNCGERVDGSYQYPGSARYCALDPIPVRAVQKAVGGVSSQARSSQGVRVGSRGPGETMFRRGGCAGDSRTGPPPAGDYAVLRPSRGRGRNCPAHREIGHAAVSARSASAINQRLASFSSKRYSPQRSSAASTTKSLHHAATNTAARNSNAGRIDAAHRATTQVKTPPTNPVKAPQHTKGIRKPRPIGRAGCVIQNATVPKPNNAETPKPKIPAGIGIAHPRAFGTTESTVNTIPARRTKGAA
jgi:hypothetical protein